MQIVLSGNRVIAHGGEYIAMGGTVICEATRTAYQNATIAEVDALPADIDSVGYEYHAGVFVPCAPYGETANGYLMVACDCGTPKRSGIAVAGDKISGEAIADGTVTPEKLSKEYLAASGGRVEGETTFNAKMNVLSSLFLGSGVYGDTLPAAGNKGRVFFLKRS